MSKWLEFKAQENKPAEIMIYGEIGDYWDGLDASTLAARIKAASGDSITVRLNTPGGSVFTAQAFYSLLRASGKTVNVFIDGICASAGTIISSAGDSVNMPENAIFMIHNPMTSLYGANAEEMRETADILDKVQETIIAAYRNKTGQTDEKLKELMAKDSYLTASEAKELGFIDNILEPFAVAATMQGGVLNVNGTKISSERLKNMPKSFVNVVESVKTKGVTTVMNLAELQANHPEIYQAALEQGKTSVDTKTIEANAAKAERERIKDIHASALPGHEKIVAEAVENGWDAGKFAIAALKADKDKGAEFIQARNNDANPTAQVPASQDDQQNTDPAVDALASAFGVEVK
mgnify:FL=1